MAITITGSPESYPSIHNELWHVVTSNNSGVSGFKFVFDIVIGTELTRIKTFPDTSFNGVFNASNILRNYWTSYFKPNATQTAFAYTGNDFAITYTINFGEEYGGTTYTNLSTANYTAYNFYSPVFRNPSTSFFLSYADNWISTRDRKAIDVIYGEKLYMSYFKSVAGNLQLTIQKYFQGGALDSTASTGALVACQTFTLLDISPTAINTYLGSSFITTSTYAYGVKVNGANEVIVTLDCDSKFTSIPIHFLNSLGGYDTFTFRLANRLSTSVTRKNYESMPWSVTSGTMRKYDSFKRIGTSIGNFANTMENKYKLISDYLTLTDYNWLEDLICSTEVYLENGGYYYPVVISNNNWDEKLRVDKMFNLSLEVMLPNTNAQYR